MTHGHQWTSMDIWSSIQRSQHVNCHLSSTTLSVLVATCGNPCNVARIVNFVKHTGFEADEARPVVSCALRELLVPFVAQQK